MTDEDPATHSNVSNPSAPSQSPSPSLEQSLCNFESFEYHDDENAFRAIYSRDDESPSSAIISAVAVASDTDPLEMDPLHATVDPDALDVLLAPRRAAVGDFHIALEYQGYEVAASSYGSLKIKPMQAPTSPAAADD